MTKVRRGFPTIVRVLAVFLLFATPAGIGAPATAAPSAEEVQGERRTRLHVPGSAAVDQVALHMRRKVVIQWDGVKVPRKDDPRLAAGPRTGTDDVSGALEVKVPDRTEGGLHCVGYLLLVTGDRLDVDERAGERDRIGEDIGAERGRERHAPRLPVA